MYEPMFLPSADLDMMEAEAYLEELSPAAADKLADTLEQNVDNLIEHPFMYRAYADKPYFRCMPLVYDYLCFYHVDEKAKKIEIHRILRSMRDIQNTL